MQKFTKTCDLKLKSEAMKKRAWCTEWMSTVLQTVTQNFKDRDESIQEKTSIINPGHSHCRQLKTVVTIYTVITIFIRIFIIRSTEIKGFLICLAHQVWLEAINNRLSMKWNNHWTLNLQHFACWVKFQLTFWTIFFLIFSQKIGK